MSLNADAYRQALAALRPPGRAWPADPDAVQQRLLHAWADELARVDARAADLLDEADPRLTTELLAEWETAYGLPDACFTRLGIIITDPAERRRVLVARIIDPGGQRAADFIAYAADLGITIRVAIYPVHHVGRGLDCRLNGPDWAWSWELILPGPDDAPDTIAQYFWSRCYSVADDIDTPLRAWGSPLECLLRGRVPAHTHLFVSYTTVPEGLEYP